MHLLKTCAFGAFYDFQIKVKSYKERGIVIRYAVDKRNFDKEF